MFRERERGIVYRERDREKERDGKCVQRGKECVLK